MEISVLNALRIKYFHLIQNNAQNVRKVHFLVKIYINVWSLKETIKQIQKLLLTWFMEEFQKLNG